MRQRTIWIPVALAVLGFLAALLAGGLVAVLAWSQRSPDESLPAARERRERLPHAAAGVPHAKRLRPLVAHFHQLGYRRSGGESLAELLTGDEPTLWIANVVPPRSPYNAEWALRSEMLWLILTRQRGFHPGLVAATQSEWDTAAEHFPAETAAAIDDMLELLEPTWRQDTQAGPSVDDLLAEARIEVVQRDLHRDDDELNADPSKFNWYWLELQSHTPAYIASVRLDDSSGVGVGHASLTIRLEGK